MIERLGIMNVAFLKKLLAAPGPSGAEEAPAQVWRAEARTFADEVFADVGGNSYAILQGGAPRIMLGGHIDEIGLMITHIDEQGFLWFDRIGGWDNEVFVGQRVRLSGRSGPVIGVVGKKPPHLLSDEQSGVSKIENLWLDIGACTYEEALEQVKVGAIGVLDAPIYELLNRRIISRALDNRVGTFIVLEALRRLSEQRPPMTVAAIASTQEEIRGTGAAPATYRFDPHIALIVDVTFATDHPQSNRQRDGDVKLGGGVVLAPGSVNSPLIYKRLIDIAEREQIPYAVQATPRDTGTDADAVAFVRQGVAAAVISIPNRYMHSPNEMVDLGDVEQVLRLIVAFVHSVQSEQEFIPA